MPIAPNMVDPVIWNLYDEISEAAGATTEALYSFFTRGILGRTKAQTNVEMPQRLPDPEWMNVWSIGFQFSSRVIKADIDEFLDNYWFEFWVGQKIYYEGPLIVAPAGVGLYGATAVANESAWSIGHPSITNVPDLRLPPPVGDGIIGITILQGQQFKVEVRGEPINLTAGNAGGQGLKLRCFLYGIKSRGVQ